MNYNIFTNCLQVICKNEAPTGDVLLDEALTHIKQCRVEEGVQVIVVLLSLKFLLVLVTDLVFLNRNILLQKIFNHTYCGSYL